MRKYIVGAHRETDLPPASDFFPTGRLWLLVLLSVDVFAVSLLWVKPPKPDTSRLTGWGAFFFRPEHDFKLYIGSLVLAVSLTVLWSRRLRGLADKQEGIGSSRWQAADWTIGLIAGAAFWSVFLVAGRYVANGLPVPAKYLIGLGIIGLFLAGAAVRRLRPSKRGPAGGRLSDEWPAPSQSKRWTTMAADVGRAFTIAMLVYVPDPHRLAGRIFDAERMFHWNFFAMGPALSFRNGSALGSETFSFYGVGWPAVFSTLWGDGSPSYSAAIGFSVIYASVYFGAVYMLLRLTGISGTWALCGTLSAMLLHLFMGGAEAATVWRFPPITVMRRAFDVWFFLVLVMHLRTRKRIWAVCMGAVGGLAVFMETDTGLYLVAAFCLYWAALWALGPRRESLRTFFTSGTVLALTGLAGFAWASRWTFWQAGFWSGWLETFKAVAGGYTLTPLIGRMDDLREYRSQAVGLTLFIVLLCVSLLSICNLAARIVSRRARLLDVLLGCLGFYGFLTMTHFVGRSHKDNANDASIFIVIVLAIVAGRYRVVFPERVRQWAGPSRIARKTMAAVPSLALLIIVGVLMARSPAFRLYPNLLTDSRSPRQSSDLCLIERPPDICGIESYDNTLVRNFQTTVKELKSLAAGGSQVALLDSDDTLHYVAADMAPWGRYSPLYPNILTKAHLLEIAAELEARGPEYVMIKSRPPESALFQQTWIHLHAAVVRSYEPSSSVGDFEVWRRDCSAASACRKSAL